MRDEFRLDQRGLTIFVPRVETTGRPPDRVSIWANLHFLPVGSPFCCGEPDCHLPLVPPDLDELSNRLRLSLCLRQPVELEIVEASPVVSPGVEFDTYGRRTPVPDRVDQVDGLGRTALHRAATRGYGEQVAELLDAGADPTIAPRHGASVLQLAKDGRFADYVCDAIIRSSQS